jgi:L-alanine-DL-glutamate epimerase-like enolase superfamily enzyme
MPRDFDGWAIKAPHGILLHTSDDTRSKAIEKFIAPEPGEDFRRDWRDYREMGFKAVKIVVYEY